MLYWKEKHNHPARQVRGHQNTIKEHSDLA